MVDNEIENEEKDLSVIVRQLVEQNDALSKKIESVEKSSEEWIERLDEELQKVKQDAKQAKEESAAVYRDLANKVKKLWENSQRSFDAVNKDIAKVATDVSEVDGQLRLNLNDLHDLVMNRINQIEESDKADIKDKSKINNFSPEKPASKIENEPDMSEDFYALAKIKSEVNKVVFDSTVYEEADRSRKLVKSPARNRRAKKKSSSRSASPRSLSNQSDDREHTEKKKFRIPPQFRSCDGTNPGEFLDWLAKIERAASASEWSGSYKCWLIANLVEGRAAQALDACDGESRKTWKKLRKKLVKKIVPSQHFEQMRNELRRLHQRTNEDINAYISEFQEKARRAFANETPGRNEDEIVRLFISGLNSELLRLKVLEQRCKTLDEAAEYVLSTITLQELAKTKTGKPAAPSYGAAPNNPGFRYYATPPGAQRRNGGRNAYPNNRSAGCFNCGALDHYKAQCPNPPRRPFVPPNFRPPEPHPDQQDHYVCAACGGSGHMRSHCPFVNSAAGPSNRPDLQNMNAAPTTESRPSMSASAAPNPSATSHACMVTYGSLHGRRVRTNLHAIIMCELGSAEVVAHTLVDNGSVCNIIKESVYVLIRDQYPMRPSSVNEINSMTGHSLKVLGEAVIEIGIGHPSLAKFSSTYLIVETLPFDLVIGAEGMYDGWITVDVRHKVVLSQMNGQYLAVDFLQPLDGETQFSCLVTLQDSMKIPPESIRYVMAQINGVHGKATGHFEADAFLQQRSLTGINAIFETKDGLVPVALMNSSNKAVKLHKGTVLGQAVSLDVSLACSAQVDRKDGNSQTGSNLAETIKLDPDKAEQFLKNLMKNSNTANSSLSEDQRDRLKAVLSENADLFTDVTGSVGRTTMVKHSIDTGDAPPVFQPARRIPETQKEIIDAEVEKMLSSNVVKPSSSPYRANFVLVKKKDGTWRPCIDFRMLNNVTKKDVYPLPRIDETLDTLGSAKIFSTLDLASGYWQVELDKKSQEKTAFYCRKGLFEFTVMPFGLCNAPSTFQRLMDLVLNGFLWNFCTVYLDDIVIFSPSFDEHLVHIQKVFERLRQAGLTLKGSKCEFGRKEVPYLGHIISADGVKPDPKKIDAIVQWPVPKDKKELASFMGLMQYYRRFSQNFSMKAAPLNDLRKAATAFNWTSECQTTFERLKEEATRYPTLRYPDFKRRFVIYTDACERGLGAVLAQFEGDTEWVISYASRTLSDAERKYHINDKEMLAIFWAVTGPFRPYVFGRPFDLVTDSSSARALGAYKGTNGRILRWQQELSSYDFAIYHRKGLVNSNADGLSRRPDPESPVNEVVDSPAVTKVPAFVTSAMCHDCPQEAPETTVAFYAQSIPVTTAINNEEEPPQIIENWSELQFHDDYCGTLMAYLTQNKLPKNEDGARAVINASTNFVVADDRQLYRITIIRGNTVDELKLVVPDSRKNTILQYFHDSIFGAHMGMVRTLKRIQAKYWWPKMWDDVQEWVQCCKVCQEMKASPNPGNPLQSLPVGKIFDQIAMDILELPLTTNGNRYVIVCSEYLSKWVVAAPLQDTKAETVAKFMLQNVILQHGAPKSLLTDQGKQFTSALIKELCKLLQINKLETVPYRPQTDGLVERFNRTLIQMLAASAREYSVDWDNLLPFVVFAYNTSVQESSKLSPFQLIYGRLPQYPIDLEVITTTDPTVNGPFDAEIVQQRMCIARRIASENIEAAQKRSKKYYDMKTNTISYDIGESVMYMNNKRHKGVRGKLEKKWIGPFVVVERVSKVIYVIRAKYLQAPERRVHVDQLRPFYTMAPLEKTKADDNTRDVTRADPPADHYGLANDQEKARSTIIDDSNKTPFVMTPGTPVVIVVSTYKATCGYILPEKAYVVGRQDLNSLKVMLFGINRAIFVNRDHVYLYHVKKQLLPARTRLERETIDRAEKYCKEWYQN